MGRILVVDDEIQVVDFLKKFLVLKGYEVDTALDGPTAIDKVKEFRPHIVLLDIRMPGMGGLEVLKELKKGDPTVEIIMITAVSDQDIALKTLELGAYDYITKPLDLEYLDKVVMMKIMELTK